jgi:hypothetical protein
MQCARRIRSLLSLLILGFCISTVTRADELLRLRAVPDTVRLTVPETSEQLIVWAGIGDGPEFDATGQVEFSSTPEGVVWITPSGLVTPVNDGRAVIAIRQGVNSVSVPVEVTGITAPTPVSFRQDVVPILSKAGCNSGGCHGKAEGQNGFKLSVFGFDTRGDHQALTMEAHGRRISRSHPEGSLLLLKGSGKIPHGGGRKLEPGSRWYRLLQRWVSEGATYDSDAGEVLSSIEVEPRQITLAPRSSQQLRVVAVRPDGSRHGVTAECDFQSNQDAIASVDVTGRIAVTDVPGEAAILVRYQGHVAVCRVTRPQAERQFVRPAERNFIDTLVWNKLDLLGIPVSPLADDATFLRRVFLDMIGTLPTAEEARAFLSDTAPDKRQRLVTSLFQRPEYADYWSLRWADLLQVDKDLVTPQGAQAMTRWIRSQVARNVPYDQFVRSILTAEGATLAESPAGFFVVQKDPEKLARSVSQLFLGVRIECAQCHHHPFERWDQKDYVAFAGFFTGVDRRAGPGGGQKIVEQAGTNLPHPRSQEIAPAAGLGAPAADFSKTPHRRTVLAQWVTAPENPYFARSLVNRLWAHYMGRGLVEPIDDLRVTNPASNEPLLDALAQHLIDRKYDVQALTRTLLDSHVYQLASRVEGTNAADLQNHSHASWKALPAEVLLDAISQSTDIPEEFNGWPAGYRAIQVWDNRLPSDFLEVFGRPVRQSVCACERGSDPTIAQALHLMNSTRTDAKIRSRDGRAARLAASTMTDSQIIDELYLTTLTRFPSDDERKRVLQAFADSPHRREAVEDILWTLLNTKEFVFNH